MKAYVFPGQGSQYPGMGKDLYSSSKLAKELFLTADEILGFLTFLKLSSMEVRRILKKHKSHNRQFIFIQLFYQK